jgi:Lipase (class 3)
MTTFTVPVAPASYRLWLCSIDSPAHATACERSSGTGSMLLKGNTVAGLACVQRQLFVQGGALPTAPGRLLRLFSLHNARMWRCQRRGSVPAGHSLGGALATLAAFDIQEACKTLPQMSLSVCGQPVLLTS